MEINKIYLEHCLDTIDRMPDNFIDCTLTSPPYDNIRGYTSEYIINWSEDIWRKVIANLLRVTKIGGVCVWVVNDQVVKGSKTGTSFKQALHAIDCGWLLHDVMIYRKTSSLYPCSNRYSASFEYMFIFSKGKPKTVNLIKDKINVTVGQKISTKEREYDGSITISNGHKKGKIKGFYSVRQNVWDYATGFNISSKDELAFKHPAIFPEKLAADHIATWSNKDDLIYDPFMGSGTTAKMCHQYGRRWIGSEISKEYYDIAYKRLHPYLMQKTLF